MKAILVRVGIDQSDGGWNAPADPATGQFVYVPIPEKPGTRFRAGCRRTYDEVLPALRTCAEARGLDLDRNLKWPESLAGRPMHLDPDFEHLTYGDVGNARGSGMRDLTHALASTLHHDRSLLRPFLRWIGLTDVPAAKALRLTEQQVPGLAGQPLLDFVISDKA